MHEQGQKLPNLNDQCHKNINCLLLHNVSSCWVILCKSLFLFFANNFKVLTNY